MVIGKRLVEELMRLKEERRHLDGKREDLARAARQMQTKAQAKRSQGTYSNLTLYITLPSSPL